jgi:signal transduction histidine kinase
MSDNGPGIEQKYYEKIFQIFQTLAPRDESENTGIGLALVKRIVEMNGGRIWLESELGKGTTFWFTIPKRG